MAIGCRCRSLATTGSVTRPSRPHRSKLQRRVSSLCMIIANWALLLARMENQKFSSSARYDRQQHVRCWVVQDDGLQWWAVRHAVHGRCRMGGNPASAQSRCRGGCRASSPKGTSLFLRPFRQRPRQEKGSLTCSRRPGRWHVSEGTALGALQNSSPILYRRALQALPLSWWWPLDWAISQPRCVAHCIDHCLLCACCMFGTVADRVALLSLADLAGLVLEDDTPPNLLRMSLLLPGAPFFKPAPAKAAAAAAAGAWDLPRFEPRSREEVQRLQKQVGQSIHRLLSKTTCTHEHPCTRPGRTLLQKK